MHARAPDLVGGTLEAPTDWRSWDTFIDQLCPVLLVPSQSWEEGWGWYFS